MTEGKVKMKRRFRFSAKESEGGYISFTADGGDVRIGGVLVRIEPRHKKMPIPYDNLPVSYDAFNGYEIKMTAEELRGFARGYGGLY
jgi:hypothetical protein